MGRKPCKCCEHKKPGATSGGSGYGFNNLEGEARAWAASNKLAKSEFCIRVKGGKKFKGPEWIRVKCGDGRMGFSTRRKERDDVRIEVGLDGQYKRNRHTLVNTRSARAIASRRPRRVDGGKISLVTLVAIGEAQRDPIAVAQQRKEYKKSERARNRNNAARRGHKRSIK